MNLGDVMEEIGQRMSLLDGISTFDYPVDKPPTGHAALLSIPQRIDYRGTNDIAGMSRYTLPLVIMIPRQDAKSMMRAVAEYASDSGERSIRAHLESWTWLTCDEVTVLSAEFDAVDWGGVPYMAGLYTLDIVGSGA